MGGGRQHKAKHGLSGDMMKTRRRTIEKRTQDRIERMERADLRRAAWSELERRADAAAAEEQD